MRTFVLVTCIAACGRIGFGPAGAGGGDDVLGDGGVPSNEIGISLVTDGDGDNMPIQNAVVLIDRGDGTLERVATSDTGVAVFGATTPTRFVVVYSDAANSWRVTDVDAVPPGTVVHFGARPSPTFDHTTTMTLPAASGSNIAYRVMVPAYCGYTGNNSSTAVNLLYVTQCEGQSVHAIVEAVDASSVRAFDAGHVTLTNHGAVTLSGTYATGQTYTVNVANVAGAAIDSTILGAVALLDPDLGLIGLGDYGSQSVVGPNATVAPRAEALGNALVLEISGGVGAYEWFTSNVATRPITATMSVDARQLLPIITSMTLPPSATAASWTVAPATAVAPVLYAYEANIMIGARTVRWTAYRGGSATSLQFPQLPPDLAGADPTNGTWSDAVIVGIAYPGATYAGLLSTLDRDWHSWGGRITSDNFSFTDSSYSSGLGPP